MALELLYPWPDTTCLMSLLKMFVLAVVIILMFYALNEVTGWLDMPLPGS